LPITSMTGFGRASGRHGLFTWTWEAKSVNGRNLDLRCRLPSGMDAIEPSLRALASERFQRGNLNLSLAVQRQSAGEELQVNRSILERLIEIASELGGRGGLAPASIDGLLAVRGVIDVVETTESDADRVARESAMVESARAALDLLQEGRSAEGRRIQVNIVGLLGEIEGLVTAAAKAAEVRIPAWRARLRQHVDEILADRPAISEERLAQEVALLIVRGDIDEEIVRLRAHVEAARSLLDAGSSGRQLDFLCQEFNREANTLCSKSGDVELTRVGLDLKVAIDRLREQVQNIE
jgi:uncharacterized protein (TIGR00255 family)